MTRQFLLLASVCAVLAGCNNTDSSNPSDPRNKTGSVPSENEADRLMTQKIRQTLMDDNSLSTQAKNVKIITVKGAVTLRGFVKDENEKDAVAKKAKGIAGVRSVDNQIEILNTEPVK